LLAVQAQLTELLPARTLLALCALALQRIAVHGAEAKRGKRALRKVKKG
jgi:hypothetical protein